MDDQIIEDIPEADQEFLDYIKRPVSLNKKKAEALIDDLDETIMEMRKKLSVGNRMEKNTIYNQIQNRESQIKYAKTFL